MTKRIIRTLLCAGALCCALAVSARADCIGGAQTATDVNLRAGASLSAQIVDTLAPGTRVVVERDAGGGWYQVRHDGETGYMFAQYLDFSETMELRATGWVNGTEVRQRAEASTAAEIQRVTAAGERVEILGVAGAWYRVSAGGRTGYIRSDYVVLSEDELTLGAGQRVVDLAMQYLGYSYVWAGASPQTGFDCSGFVSYVFKTLGYETNRTAADIYKNGSYVAKDELEPGDAVFFASSSNAIGHVGIYIGDGEFVHSSSGCGYVTVSGLDESYYARMYVGARRIAA